MSEFKLPVFLSFLFIFALFFPLFHTNADIATGLVGYWNFNEESGTVAEDSSINNNNGVLYNGATWTTGMVDGGVQVDASNDYIGLGNSSVYDFGTGSFSVSLWYNPEVLPSSYRYLTGRKNGANGKGWSISQSSGSSKCFEVKVSYYPTNTPNSAESNYCMGTITSANVWHHIAFTSDTTNYPDVTVSYYLDGQYKFSRTINVGSGTVNQSSDLNLNNFFGHYTAGKFDEFRLYNRALSAAEIAELYSYDGGQTTNESLINNNSTTFRTLWNDNYLYVAAKIIDSNLVNDSTDPWLDDSVEIYLDSNDNKLTAYDIYDRHFVKGYNDTTLTAHQNGTGVLHGVADIVGGYTVEIAIPWSNIGVTPYTGMSIGFELQQNDDDTGGDTRSSVGWNSTNDDNSENTSSFGTLVLSSTKIGSTSTGSGSIFSKLTLATSTDSLQTTMSSSQNKVTLINALKPNKTSTYRFLRQLSIGLRDSDVTELQKRLTSEGVYSGPITGFYGPMTREGVRKYQAKNNLPSVGRVGPQTLSLLNGSSSSASSSSQSSSLRQLVELLISLGVIAPDKADAARTTLQAMGGR